MGKSSISMGHLYHGDVSHNQVGYMICRKLPQLHWGDATLNLEILFANAPLQRAEFLGIQIEWKYRDWGTCTCLEYH